MAFKLNTFSFTTKRTSIYLRGKLLIDLSNTYITTDEAIRFICSELNASKLDALVKKNGVEAFFNQCYNDGKIFPRLLTKWMTEYGYEPNLKGWNKFEEDFVFNRFPSNPVEEDVSEMSDQKLRAFVRKHGPSNIEHYHTLRKQLSYIDDPDTGLDREQRQQEKLEAWQYAALRITGLDHEDAADEMVRNHWIG